MSALAEAADESRHRIAKGVAWLQATPREQRPGSVITHLKAQGLSAPEACAALREFHLRLARAS